ncbi:MAG: thiol peroxidase [Muribaculaceae bacterium]|nr:thiol peroxidase [Muribaculaceae bacterium]
MATVKLGGNPIHTCGDLPAPGSKAPEFSLVNKDLSDLTLESLKGKRVVLNIFPSVDTDVCAASVRRFNKEVSELDNTVVVCISRDLPFALGRFCAANGIDNVYTVSGFRSDFGKKYGVELTEGPLAGLYARSVVVIDEDGNVTGSSFSPEITEEPDYEMVKSLLKK